MAARTREVRPARAHVSTRPSGERYLPTDVLVALLELQGGETVVDYGAGTGRLTIPVARALRDGGRVVAVDSSDEMLGHLRMRLERSANVDVVQVADDAVARPTGAADRVLAVNFLHEVRGEERPTRCAAYCPRTGSRSSSTGSAAAPATSGRPTTCSTTPTKQARCWPTPVWAVPGVGRVAVPLRPPGDPDPLGGWC